MMAHGAKVVSDMRGYLEVGLSAQVRCRGGRFVARWLKEDVAPLEELAGRLGYQSEAAFSRAFKRLIGTSPGTARRNGESATFGSRSLGQESPSFTLR